MIAYQPALIPAPTSAQADTSGCAIAAETALAASLQALVNGFLRECPALPGDRKPSSADHRPQVDIALGHTPATLRLHLRYISMTGPLKFGTAQLRFNGERYWQSAPPTQVISLIAQECFHRTGATDPAKLPAFLRAIFNSNAEIEAALHHTATTARPTGFHQAEQSLVYGHWLHPTPKSRDGLTDWQQVAYAPEYAGEFQLHLFAARADIIRHDSVVAPISEILNEIPGLKDNLLDDLSLRPDEQLIPAHPLQAQALLLTPTVQALLASGQLRDLGPAGPRFTPSSSLRTVFSANCPWMLKFSVPVRLTNSLRVTLTSELQQGVAMARLLRKLNVADSLPQFQIIDDPAYLTVTDPKGRESGFEVIFRRNPFQGTAGDGIFTLAALTADPHPGRASLLATQIRDLATRSRTTRRQTAARWFKAYLACMLTPVLTLYDRHGIALEAHQQNALLDLSTGLPQRGYYRDNQGYFITEDAFTQLREIEPSLANVPALVFSRGHINARLTYYLVVNQIFAVIWRMGCDGLVPEQALLLQLRDHLQQMMPRLTGAARALVSELLQAPRLATKANLLTRLHDLDELQTETQEGVFLDMPNPLAALQPQTTEAVADVFA
ncbi:IucA/IucC family protein [Phaeobacter gallaeciensis]|uniref:Siderophore synthetase component n=1 Tax=Phaeobacter gallaeciensis TaxID=60890 RepID=A0AAD0EF26_9RHOB|nr:IucA/IucC family protein [Phaeobacter gallaeciensis]AHD11946.1 Siderophore synthetase component [Phaeobacter gallaeciensis DSM 26640]ATE95212.1 Siderophore synthetase component [Phaeobacter gallaeciensis]ATE99603.1 Siderophore synthetase component [Phaeobacter gallaeciensis]ATF03917.1 Siderophore synthetase component [Phaeobacter gallaeciensis]ATF08193.1 Siderophore synthetase component [Phaeobacter gallaeciensis]